MPPEPADHAARGEFCYNHLPVHDVKMNLILSAISAIKALFELLNLAYRQKREAKGLRVAFHCAFSEGNLTPVPEIGIVNTGDFPQTVEYLFASVGRFRKKTFPLFVEWGERELPQVVDKGEKVFMRLAGRGALADVAGHKDIRLGVVTDLGDRFLGERIDNWQKGQLRSALGLAH